MSGPDNGPRKADLFYAADGYWPLEAPITLEKDQTYTRDVDLIPVCRGVTVTGVVRDAVTGLAIPFARVVTDAGVGVDADDQGRYRLENLDVGSQNSPTELDLIASKRDYVPQTRSVEIFCGAKVAVGTPASIVIRKVTDPPGDPASFSFTGALGTFDLAHGQSRTSSGLFPGIFDVQETVPAGWALSEVTCGDQPLDIEDGLVAIDVAAGENLTCTFTNQRLGTVVIRKTTLPTGDPTPFEFSGPVGDFMLADGQSQTISDLPPGEHPIFEFAAEPWETTNAACDDDDSGPTDPEFGSVRSPCDSPRKRR